jgi:hypothetical protein
MITKQHIHSMLVQRFQVLIDFLKLKMEDILQYKFITKISYYSFNPSLEKSKTKLTIKSKTGVV